MIIGNEVKTTIFHTTEHRTRLAVGKFANSVQKLSSSLIFETSMLLRVPLLLHSHHVTAALNSSCETTSDSCWVVTVSQISDLKLSK